MKPRPKITGTILLAAAIAACIWLYASGKFGNFTGNITETAMSTDMVYSSNDDIDTSEETKFMSFNAIPIMTGLWEITDGTAGSPAFVDIYLIEGNDKALVIDAGVSGADLSSYIRTLTRKPAELVLTHGHGDHVAAAGQFEKVYMSSKDFDLIKPYTAFKDFKDSGINDLKGGEIFDLGGCKLEIVPLPGHTPGSVVLLDRERQLLFAGDAMGSSSLWMQLPESGTVEEYRDEMRNFEKSIESLTDLKPYLGHNCLMGCKPDKAYITDTRIAAEKIVSGELKGVPTDREDFPGAVTASYGQMTDFLYRPEKVRKAGK